MKVEHYGMKRKSEGARLHPRFAGGETTKEFERDELMDARHILREEWEDDFYGIFEPEVIVIKQFEDSYSLWARSADKNMESEFGKELTAQGVSTDSSSADFKGDFGISFFHGPDAVTAKAEEIIFKLMPNALVIRKDYVNVIARTEKSGAMNVFGG